MNSQKYYLIGHSSPNGMSWLFNCLLELGIKTDSMSGKHPSNWVEEGGCFVPKKMWAAEAKAWFPILSKHSKFKFRPDITVEWGHYWYCQEYIKYPVIYFVRHPQDSIYSLYKRRNPEISFAEFVNSLEPTTLLNNVDNWVLFNRAWLAHGQLEVVRFEDYKRDAEGTLSKVLNYMGLSYSDTQIARACEESSFEKARETEMKHRQTANISPDGWPPVINRAGKVGNWQQELTGKENWHVMQYIEDKTAQVLVKLGYQPNELGDQISTDYTQHVKLLSFFDEFLFKDRVLDTPGTIRFDNPIDNVIKFCRALDNQVIIKARYYDWQVNVLLSNLVEYLEKLDKNNDSFMLEFNKVLKLFHRLVSEQNKKLQTICDERLAVIQQLDSECQKRLEVIQQQVLHIQGLEKILANKSR